MLKMNVLIKFLALAAILVLGQTAAEAGTLDQVKKRGYLMCGSSPGVAGFGLPDDKGNWTGFDVDFCPRGRRRHLQ